MKPYVTFYLGLLAFLWGILGSCAIFMWVFGKILGKL